MQSRKTSSLVAFTDSACLVGDSARQQAGLNACNSIYAANRLFGCGLDGAGPALASEIAGWPFRVLRRSEKDDSPVVEVSYRGRTRFFAPEEIAALVLQHMQVVAESALGEPVAHVVLSCPVLSNSKMRDSIRLVGEIAGLNTIRVVGSSTLASLAYAVREVEGVGVKSPLPERNLLVFDLGGGTLDISLVTIEDGIVEVKAVSGDKHLGGEDFDSRLVEWCISEFRAKAKQDVSAVPRAARRLRVACERAKRVLSGAAQALIEVDALSPGVDFSATITRTKFEELCAAELGRIAAPLERVLRDAKMEKSSVHEVLLVGGSSRVPAVVALLKGFFDGKEPSTVINPDEAVATGAAFQAAFLSGLVDTGGKLDELFVLEASPVSFGIETANGVFTPIIKRNTTIPTKKKLTFPTVEDNQTSATYNVFEGEHTLVKDNRFVGSITLNGIPAKPAGEINIEVVLDIDAAFAVRVCASIKLTETTNGPETIVRFPSSHGFSSFDVDGMRAKLEGLKNDNERVRATASAKNDLEQLIFRVREAATNASVGKRLAVAEVRGVEGVSADALAWLEAKAEGSKEEYEAKAEELRRYIAPLRERLIAGGISFE